MDEQWSEEQYYKYLEEKENWLLVGIDIDTSYTYEYKNMDELGRIFTEISGMNKSEARYFRDFFSEEAENE